MNLTLPYLINQYADQEDRLVIRINDQIFYGVNSKKTNEANVTISSSIPPQIEYNYVLEALEESKKSIMSITQTLFAGNYAISLVMSASMNLLWSLLNSL